MANARPPNCRQLASGGDRAIPIAAQIDIGQRLRGVN
jgi:hypothetical protein